MSTATLSRRDALGILRAGQEAARSGMPAIACPYSANGDGTERLRVAAWMRGYTLAGGSLTAAAGEPEAMTSTVVVALPAEGEPIEGVGPEQKHTTLLWFGEVDDATADSIRAATEAVARGSAATEVVRSIASVGPLGDDEPQALVAYLDDDTPSPRLADLREDVLAADDTGAVRQAWEAQKQWPTFTPHVTLGYPDEPPDGQTGVSDAEVWGEAALEVGQVTFDRLAVWQGDRQDEYPLDDDDADAGEDPPNEDEETEAMTAAAPEVLTELTWEGPLVAEGIETGDKRKMRVGALEWMGDPGILHAMFDGGTGFGGHEKQIPVGLIKTIERRDDGRLWATGTWIPGDPDSEKARQWNIDGRLRGVSVDLDSVEISFEDADGNPITGDAIWDMDIDDPEPVLIIEKGRIRGATLWSIPAFVEAYVLDSTVADQIPDTSIVSASTPTGVALAASAAFAPTKAPPGVGAASWFDYPGVEALTEEDGFPRRLHVDGERVYGYLATWGVCHIGIAGVCVEPQPSPSEYRAFHRGTYQTSDGQAIRVGPLTIGTGHADLDYGERATIDHYDHTGAVAAYVRMGEDDTGIWFSGAIREDLSLPQRHALARAGTVSGDWRGPTMDDLDLMAALVVNVEGFSTPRVGVRVASAGASLVAAGIPPASDPPSPMRAPSIRELAAEVAAYTARQERHRVLLARMRSGRVERLRQRVATGKAGV